MAGKVSRRVLARTVAAKILAEPTREAHWIQAAAAYLLENNLAEDAALLANDINRELYAQGGLLRVSVTSARPLSESLRTDLTKRLRSTTNASHIQMTESVDPTLVGGLIARTADGELDLSVRTQLRQLATIGSNYSNIAKEIK